jgi:hypothetical protein
MEPTNRISGYEYACIYDSALGLYRNANTAV